MGNRSLRLGFAVLAIMLSGTSAYAVDQPAAVYGSGAHQFSLATGSPGGLGRDRYGEGLYHDAAYARQYDD